MTFWRISRDSLVFSVSMIKAEKAAREPQGRDSERCGLIKGCAKCEARGEKTSPRSRRGCLLVVDLGKALKVGRIGGVAGLLCEVITVNVR